MIGMLGPDMEALIAQGLRSENGAAFVLAVLGQALKDFPELEKLRHSVARLEKQWDEANRK